MENDLEELKSITEIFFQKHWKSDSNNEPPQWSTPWKFSGEVPNNAAKGCYAFLKDDIVLYIGLALNKGVPGYEDHSLGTRITNYWKWDKNKQDNSQVRSYHPISHLQDLGVNSIITLGFPKDDQNYLAASLEIFLIRELTPAMNVIYKDR